MADLLDETWPQEMQDADDAEAIAEVFAPDAEASEEAPDTDPSDTAASTAPMPEPVEPPRPKAPSPSVDAPQLRDVGATFAGWMRGRIAVAGSFLSRHRLVAAATALAFVGLILAAVLWGVDASKTPSDDQVAADARDRLAAPAHTASPWEGDDPLVLQSVEVTRKKASDTRRDGCDVAVEAVFASSSLETLADAQLSYVRKGNDWECVSASVGKASHRALSGVSTEQVGAHLEELLEAVDSASDPSDEGLVGLYRNASTRITSESFSADEQTDELTIHCASMGTFVNYECDLTARFRFVAASGAWELAGVTASSNARDLSFAPLVGTWQGAFASQGSSGGRCLAARENGLTVVIEQATYTDAGGARISGTVSGMVHLHGDLAEDAASTEGDLLLENAPFAGSLSSGDMELDVISLLAGNNPKESTAGIEFDCAVQDVQNGIARLTLTFGQADAPDAAFATLTSTHEYQDFFLLLVPYQREAHFSDYFTLTKVS